MNTAIYSLASTSARTAVVGVAQAPAPYPHPSQVSHVLFGQLVFGNAPAGGTCARSSCPALLHVLLVPAQSCQTARSLCRFFLLCPFCCLWFARVHLARDPGHIRQRVRDHRPLAHIPSFSGSRTCPEQLHTLARDALLYTQNVSYRAVLDRQARHKLGVN